MNWTLKFLPEAKEDLKELAGNQRILVLKAIEKVRQNPLSQRILEQTNARFNGEVQPVESNAIQFVRSNQSGMVKTGLKS